MSYEIARDSDLSVDQDFHHLGHQLKGGAAHLLLQLSLLLLLQLLLREKQLKLRVFLLHEKDDKVVVALQALLDRSGHSSQSPHSRAS